MSLVVMALGGNALLRRGEPFSAEAQERNLTRASHAIAEVAERHSVVVTHGSGPHVGMLARRAESARGSWQETLDVLGAETQGLIGYPLARELRNRLPGREVATLLTQVVVDPEDPAFRNPTKPIGSVLSEAEADRLVARRGWAVARDGEGWRRVVASPEPRRIVEIESVRALVGAGHLVVCGGGGGVPLRETSRGTLEGAEAVVDKDLSASLLAVGLDADALLLLTDVPGVYAEWPAQGEPIGRLTPGQARALEVQAGSMGPKVEAAARFAERTGRPATIGAMEEASALMEGGHGTRIA